MLLALDTSTLTASLALVDGERVLEEERIGPPKKQSEILPGAITALLERHGVALRDLRGFIVGLGPGSFTGLRIGLATVKALAYALRVPVAGASSLAAAAMDGPEGELMPTAVARQGELYVGHYRRTTAGVEPLGPEEAMTPAQLARALCGVALGPAIPAYRAELERHGVAPGRLLDRGAVPSAVALARLAVMPSSFDAQKLFALEPHYVRASEAERNPKFPPLPGPEPAARIRAASEESPLTRHEEES